MGQQIASGLDDKIDELLDLAATDVGFANNVIEVAEALKTANNALGTAAVVNTGTTAGNVPVLNASGKIADGVLNSTATGGNAADSGKLVALGATGTIAAAMIAGGGSGGGGLKDFKFYNGRNGPGNTQGVSSTKQWIFSTSSLRYNKPDNVTSLLVIATGAGGSGCYGPDSTGPNPTNETGASDVHGRNTRKGGGGAGGSTAIVFYPTAAASYEVRVGRGGPSRNYGQDSSSTYQGGTTTFGTDINARGGLPGNKSGNGGRPQTATVGNANNGEGLLGGQGHDGDESIFGAGSGGSSFWGGAYSGGGGVGVPNDGEVNAAPGAGGGAANGTDANGFTPRRPGHAGNDGCVLILGFG